MRTETVMSRNPIVLCENKSEMLEALKLFGQKTSIKWHAGIEPGKIKHVYETYGRGNRTDEPSYLIIINNQIHFGFDDPEWYKAISDLPQDRIMNINDFKNLVGA